MRVPPSPPLTPEINVTPLVDVVLVLLIIFLVVAPRLEQDVDVALPAIHRPDPEAPSVIDPIRVTVNREGEYFVDGQAHDLEGAFAALAKRHAEDPARRLVLRGDQSAAYGSVRELFARARRIGFPGIALMVGEIHEEDD